MRPWTRWQDWINLILGAWLFFSPWIFGVYGGTSGAWNSWVIGAAVAIFSFWALAAPASRFVEWVNFILGAWAFVAPWVLGFLFRSLAWNSWIVGVAIALIALSGATRARRPEAQPI